MKLIEQLCTSEITQEKKGIEMLYEDIKAILVKNIKARNLHIVVWAWYKHKRTVSRCISRTLQVWEKPDWKLFPGSNIKQIDESPGQRKLCERKHKSDRKH